MVLQILRVLVISFVGAFARAFCEPHRLIRPTMVEADDVRLVYETQRRTVSVREEYHVRRIDIFVQPSFDATKQPLEFGDSEKGN